MRNRSVATNQIADDWLLVYPDTYKADLGSALSKFDDDSLEEIHSFHDRIKGLQADERRKVLTELPKESKAVIEEMLEAYAREIEKANNEYYNSDSPRLTD